MQIYFCPSKIMNKVRLVARESEREGLCMNHLFALLLLDFIRSKKLYSYHREDQPGDSLEIDQ
jgi:hypothetical protein